MDEISELEKYKELLDSGAISEEEFTQMKQKLLGLKTDEEKEAERQAERAEALKEIDAMREAQKQKEEAVKQEEVQQKTAEQSNIESQSMKETDSGEKEPAKPEQEQPETEAEHVKSEAAQQEQEAAKEEGKPAEETAKAQPFAEQKHEDAPGTAQAQETQSTGRSAGSVVKSVILWIVCIFLLFMGIPSLTLQNTFYILLGIVCILLAVLACPLITSRTQDIPALATFYQIKVPVVIVLVILGFVFLMLA